MDYYRKQGFKIAIDDFGAGFAGLNMLLSTEPYMVKIDRSLISGIDQLPKKRMLTDALVSFCHKINALVVAEGIETESELDVLIDLKVDLGQGFYLARPMREIDGCPREVKAHILGQNHKPLPDWLGMDISNCVESLVRAQKPIDADAIVSDAVKRFNDDPALVDLPVVQKDRPIGIIHKHKLFYKLGQRFGFDLFSRRQVTDILEPALVFERRNRHPYECRAAFRGHVL